MKILLLGCQGQVGWELQRSLSPLGHLIACDRHQVNLETPSEVVSFVKATHPHVIVNAAAYTNVEKAETDIEKATLINVTSVDALAQVSQEIGAYLVHYSTDYVFNGQKRDPYEEDDATDPLGIYGKTKCQGEQTIFQRGGDSLIFRTSWAYAARRHNFIKTLLSLAQEREELRVVSDQWGAPTSAELIADITAHALKYRWYHQRQKGPALYHLAAKGVTNWCDYARFILEISENLGYRNKLSPGNIVPVRTSEYPTSVLRPSNSQLSTRKLERDFNLTMPNWQENVVRTIVEILSTHSK
jgi:dTDP-4-dehydrorhamnose reductase